MTLLIIIASVATGFILGCWLTMAIATTAMARSQQHMEKRVRYWQAQVADPEIDAGATGQAAPDYWPESSAGPARNRTSTAF
jgi:hypothetical protein